MDSGGVADPVDGGGGGGDMNFGDGGGGGTDVIVVDVSAIGSPSASTE